MATDKRQGRLELRDGRTLAWCEYGPVDGRPVLWFHGTPGSRYSRYGDESVYERTGVRLIGFDRPGYGESTRLPGRGVATIADDAAELLDHMSHDSVRVGGTSGGGPHALAFAARYPERVHAATVLVGLAPPEEQDLHNLIGLNRAGWYAAREGWNAMYELLAPQREKLLADPLAAFRESMNVAPPDDQAVINDPSWQRVFIENVTEALRPGAEGWTDEAMALSLSWDFDPAEARSNIVWWHGENDANAAISGVRRVVQKMDDVDLRVWEESGHLGPYYLYETVLQELASR